LLVQQMWREHRLLVIGYSVLLTLNAILSVVFWPDLRDNLETWAGIAKILPLKGIQDFVHMVELEGWWAYVGTQQFFKAGGVIAMVVAGLLGSMMVAREVDGRTAEFLFSRPISRTRLLLTRWATCLAMVVVPFLFTTLVICWLGTYEGETLEFWMVVQSCIHLSLYLAAILSLTAWFSTMAHHQLKPAFLVIGFMMFNLAIYLVKDLWSFSAYKLIDLDLLLPIRYGVYPWGQTWVFVGCIALGLFSANFCLKRKDF